MKSKLVNIFYSLAHTGCIRGANAARSVLCRGLSRRSTDRFCTLKQFILLCVVHKSLVGEMKDQGKDDRMGSSDHKLSLTRRKRYKNTRSQYKEQRSNGKAHQGMKHLIRRLEKIIKDSSSIEQN